jgi:hypothetical protein
MLRTSNILAESRLKDLQLDYERKDSQLQKREAELAMTKVEQKDLLSLKDTYEYVLREALKKMQGRENTLSHALKGLHGEETMEIVQILKENHLM